jgi:hypothetical protein
MESDRNSDRTQLDVRKNANGSPLDSSTLEQTEQEVADEKTHFLRGLRTLPPRKLPSWRFGVILGATAAATVLLANVIFLIWAILHAGIHNGGTSVLYDGDCSKVHSINAKVHLLINILSTILLSGCNYCMVG